MSQNMPPAFSEMLNSAMAQAEKITQKQRLIWKGKRFKTFDEVIDFLGDVKSIASLQVFPFEGSLCVVYAIF